MSSKKYNNKKSTAVRQVDKKTSEKKGWTRKKIVAASIIGVSALAFVGFLIFAVITHLGSIRPIKSSEEEMKVVGVCDSYEIKYEELRYITLLHRESLEKTLGKYDSLSKSDQEYFRTELEKRVEDDLKNNYAVLSLCDKYEIDTDSRAANNYVQDAIENLVENEFGSSKDKYIEWLRKNNLTDSFLRLMYKVNYLENELLDYFVDKKIDIEFDSETKNDFIDYVMKTEGWVRTIHLYYPSVHPWSIEGNVPPEILEVDAEYIKKIVSEYDALKSIQKAYDNISNAKNDDERLYIMQKSEISKAPTTEYTISGNGLYFTYGQMGEAYEDAAFGIDIYEASEIFEMNDGYYIVMRLPLNEDDVQKRVDDLLKQYQYAALKKHLDARYEEMSFEGNEYYSQISLIDIE